MDIFNSVNEIRKNSSNFKQWEIEQDSTDAKRQALAKKNPPSDQQLKDAKDLGTTIIDVVDIMDQHSEDVAENVETATSIPMGLFPAATLVGTGFLSGKFVIKPAAEKMRKLELDFFDKNKEKFREIIDKINATKAEKDSYSSEYDVIDKKFIKKSKLEPSVKLEAEKLTKELAKIKKPYAAKGILGVAIPFVASVAAFVWGNVYTTKLQIDGSKISRFQSRKVLEDPKYFVKYTPEQIAEAKKNLKKQKDIESKETNTDKLKSGMFKGIASILRDRKEYKKWKSSSKSAPQKVNRQLTEKEFIQAQKDQEVIQRVVRKINNNAENYSANMEVAANVIMNSTPFLGAAVGGAIAAILNSMKVIPNYVQKMVTKYGDESAQKSYKAFSNAAKDAPNRNKLFYEFFGNMMESKIQGLDKEVPLKGFAKYELATKRFMTGALAHKLGQKGIFGLIGGFATGIVGAFIGLKLQKASARAGRYVAKQELEQNPQNFIGYTQQELDGVPEQPKKQKEGKIKEYTLFIPRVIKQYFNYQHYKKNELQQEKVLKDELVKLDVSDKQLKDAKNLQRKVFNTFEQVDDKSQNYSESVEAVMEMAQPIVLTAGAMAIASPLIIFGIQLARGKVTAKSVTTKIVSIVSGATNLMKKKFFKNYINGVAKHIPSAVQNTKLVKVASEEDKAAFGLALSAINEGVKHFEISKKLINTGLDELGKNIKNMSNEEVQILMAEKAEQFNNIKFIEKLDISSFDKAYIEKTLPKIQKIINNIPQEELSTILKSALDEYEKNPDLFIQTIKSGNITKFFITPGLQKSLAIAGVSWAAFGAIMTYAIEAWMADLQLKAGRLGVMKALDSLKDPAYYANIEPDSNNANQNNEHNLLNNFAKS